jgi:hypothetical protein
MQGVGVGDRPVLRTPNASADLRRVQQRGDSRV